VGIDIGTTTTQLVISRLTVKNMAPGAVIPKMEITQKQVLYKSEIHFTPINDYQLIDAYKLKQIIEQEYNKAQISAKDIQTGAVIITGETAKKENAQNILEAISGLAGDFVVATAGVNLESILAGKGSGAAAYSLEHHKVTANIDIGGGTSNIGVFKNGKTLDTACINVGGRLIEIETKNEKVKYIAEPAQKILNETGISLQIGENASINELKQIAKLMARSVVEVISNKNKSSITKSLMMTPFLKDHYKIETVMISGGVADYVYNDYNPISVADISKYGDIGPILGWAIRNELKKEAFELVKPSETIRATVIGAGIHSLDLSGSTIHVNETTLPLKNITVVAPLLDEISDEPEKIESAVKKEVQRLAVEEIDKHLALFIKEPKELTYKSIDNLAKSIVRAMKEYLKNKNILIVIIEADCGKVLGQCLERYLDKEVELVCIDQIHVQEGDYIDIGKPIMDGRVVPVVIKTLVFNTSA
jgi:ethanolamine utilization protein EutA